MAQSHDHVLTNRVIGIRRTWRSTLGAMEAAVLEILEQTTHTPQQHEILDAVARSLRIMREDMEVIDEYARALSTYVPTTEDGFEAELLLGEPGSDAQPGA